MYRKHIACYVNDVPKREIAIAWEREQIEAAEAVVVRARRAWPEQNWTRAEVFRTAVRLGLEVLEQRLATEEGRMAGA